MKRVLLVLIVILVMLTPAAAQESGDIERSPLLRALSAVPVIPEVLGLELIASYANYTDAMQARTGVVFPTYADFQAAYDMEKPEAGAAPWAFAPSGPSTLLQSFFLLKDMPEAIGLDFFQIGQAIEVGRPPTQVMAYFGAFEPTLMAEKLKALGFALESETDAGLLICSTEGCDAGAQMDLAMRNPLSPFGGDLGRRFPVMASESSIVTSPSLDVFQASVDALNGERPSAADLEPFQAVDSVLSAFPYVPGAIFLSPVMSAFDPASIIRSDDPEAVLEAINLALSENPVGLFELAAIVAAADGETESGLALFVYTDEDAALAAAASIDARLATMDSLARAGMKYAEI
ncbi:MAG: hypothetical protein B6D42_02985, partial [Anaerolineae bacterium UTCFX5]